jgi:hypothetical protein
LEQFERALLPGLPVARIRAAYASAPGKELETGKFTHPESSAALAANAFGFFLDSPCNLPPLPQTDGLGWPAVAVELEQLVRFPWSGGRHPCLDVLIETSHALIGIESKRYEPFRSKPLAELSDAYWRPVWGDRMCGYQAVRDLLRDSPRRFAHLDAAQLVKHALGLRTVARRQNRQPVLIYLYAEPPSTPAGTQVSDTAIEQHRREITEFDAHVAGDEVLFRAISYAELISLWRTSGTAAVQRHAGALDEKFFGLFRGVPEVWSDWMHNIRAGDVPARDFCAEMFAIIEENWKAGRRARGKLPSHENWRWPSPVCTLSEQNASSEVVLERRFIRACEARRIQYQPGAYEWSNQIPVASGVRSQFDRRRAIDLIQRRGERTFDFIELKTGSDDPLSAARQVVEYGMLWLISRRDRTNCGYNGPLMEANEIRLCVLAPRTYFRGEGFGKVAGQMTAGLQRIAAPFEARLSFCFEQFSGTYSPQGKLGESELIQLFEKRELIEW